MANKRILADGECINFFKNCVMRKHHKIFCITLILEKNMVTVSGRLLEECYGSGGIKFHHIQHIVIGVRAV